MTRSADADEARAPAPGNQPAALVATDLLWIDGQPLLDIPLLERRRVLDSALGEGELVRRSKARPAADRDVVRAVAGARVRGDHRSRRRTAATCPARFRRTGPSRDAPPIARLQRAGAACKAPRTGPRRIGGTVASMPSPVLTPAIREEIARLERADIMVGIPSFKNATTIGYVVRAAQAGLVQYFPDLRPVVVNSDAGSPDGTQRVVVETEPPDYVEQILLVRPDQQASPRVSLTYPEVDGSGGKGAALRTIFEMAAALEVQALVVVDSDLRSIGPEWIELLAGPDPQGRLRLCLPAVRPAQARRDDHEQRDLPADPGPVRAPDPPADRGRLRGLRRPRPALPRRGPLDARGLALRHRHLDDDPRAHRRVRHLPGATRREGPRPEGPGRRPRADVPAGRDHDPPDGRRQRRSMGDGEGQPRRPGLWVRARRRPAAARGQRPATALGVPGRFADAGLDMGRDGLGRHRRGDRRPRRGGRPHGRPRPERARDRRPRARAPVDRGDGRRRERVHLPGCRLGAGDLRPRSSPPSATPIASTRSWRRSCRCTSGGWRAS